MAPHPSIHVLAAEGPFEVVEHKALGHPDTLCDALAEELSVRLSRYYLERFGRILHHNVDKALLVGGRARPRFGGGEVLAPMEMILAGRVTMEVGSDTVPVAALAEDATSAWLRANMRALDPARHVRLTSRFSPGAQNLSRLVDSSSAFSFAPRANDTSVGAAHAPSSRLERVVLSAARTLHQLARDEASKYVGEDGKVMGLRRGDDIELVVACAFVGAHVPSWDAYVDLRERVRLRLAEAASAAAGGPVRVRINAADGEDEGAVFLTVTGTSAESGDDGQVGRGNRSNGLITPCRPMTLEAPCGKNPVSHVGKLYSVLAQRLADAAIRRVAGVARAEVLVVSAIGAPLEEPWAVDWGIELRPGATLEDVRGDVTALTAEEVAAAQELTDVLLRAGGVMSLSGVWS